MTVGKGLWSPKQTHEHSGPGGAAINVDLSSFLNGKSEEDLARIEELLGQIAATAGVVESGGDSLGDPAGPAEEG
jgi:hypothetical protein